MYRLSNEQKRALLVLVRQVISSVVVEQRLPEFSSDPKIDFAHGGTFVSLHLAGRLRGCVGQIDTANSLEDGVARAAINAALHDPRFSPVSPAEVGHLEIEISVLSVPEPVPPEGIVPGRHGVIIERYGQRGLLLPQVAAERNWSAETLLEETCVKAGLKREAWRDSLTQILGFTAEVFSERTHIEISDI